MRTIAKKSGIKCNAKYHEDVEATRARNRELYAKNIDDRRKKDELRRELKV
jgi:hypothetical protein